jgi:hypothetical protein
MSPELTAALQNLLNCQFQAGRALGLYEAALAAESPKPPEPAAPPPAQPALPPVPEALKNHPNAMFCGNKPKKPAK